MKIVSKMISLVVAVCVMTSAFLFFQPAQRVEAAESGFETVASSTHTIINYEYAKMSAVMYEYRVIVKVTQKNLYPITSTQVWIKSGQQMDRIMYNLELNLDEQEFILPVNFDGQKGNYNNDGLDNIYITPAADSHVLQTLMTLQRRPLGAYEFLGEAYVNIKDGHIGDKTVDCNVFDVGRYDYFIGYHIALPRPNQTIEIVASIPSESRNLFRQTFLHLQGDFGLVDVTDIIGNNDTMIRLEAHQTMQTSIVDIGAGGIALYRKAKPVSGSISATVVNIGDNTPVSINVSFYTEEASCFEVYNIATGQTLYSGTSGNYAGVVNVNIANEGEIPLGLRARSANSGNIIFTGNSVWINKRNMLDEAITNLNAVKSTAQVAILNDQDRYFEDNAQNRALVQTILQRAAGTYLIYSDVSPVL